MKSSWWWVRTHQAWMSAIACSLSGILTIHRMLQDHSILLPGLRVSLLGVPSMAKAVLGRVPLWMSVESMALCWLRTPGSLIQPLQTTPSRLFFGKRWLIALPPRVSMLIRRVPDQDALLMGMFLGVVVIFIGIPLVVVMEVPSESTRVGVVTIPLGTSSCL